MRGLIPSRLRKRLVSMGFVSVLALLFTVTVLTPHAYAVGYTVLISPNPVVAGQTMTVSGSTGSAGSSGDHMFLEIDTDLSAAHDCSGTNTIIKIGPQTLGPSLTFSFTVTLSVTPGFYCAAVDDVGSSTTFTFPISNSDFFSVSVMAPPIPEYPYGLPILAIFTILAYAVIKRKTRN